MKTKTKLWAIMPAAGVGARMGMAFPKQYLRIHSKTVLERSVELMLCLKNLERLVLCLAQGDAHFSALKLNDPRVHTALGGASRADSVLNGLCALENVANDQDWVIVHDAARPCLEKGALRTFVETIQQREKVGGILALKCKDTLKKAASDKPSPKVAKTVDRSLIWQAQTPQMFRYGLLREALNQCRAQGIVVTDESSALEQVGHKVALYQGSATNIKITTPEDRHLAEFLLSTVATPS